MVPTREEAERILREGERMNPGVWGDHSRTVAFCAERIAEACGNLDPEKAYILGLLHDIGRRNGVSYLRHVLDGFIYMGELGYDEAARICLSHSFVLGCMEDYIGEWDVTKEEEAIIRGELAKLKMDDYDRLIQLCDALGGPGYIMGIRERMEDVKRRYGKYPQEKWEANLRLKALFEARMGQTVETVLKMESMEVKEHEKTMYP